MATDDEVSKVHTQDMRQARGGNGRPVRWVAVTSWAAGGSIPSDPANLDGERSAASDPTRRAGSGSLLSDPARLVLRGGALADGTPADIALDPRLGVVLEVGAVAAHPDDRVERVDGMVLLPAATEPHTHLDKVFLAVGAPGAGDDPGRDLSGAIAAMRHADNLRDDVAIRAARGLQTLVAHGVTAVRTHVDVRRPFGTGNIEALAQVRRWATDTGLADLQLVALVDTPLTGAAGADNRRNLHEAIEAGADVVGGCPYRDPEPRRATEWLLEVAAASEHRLNIHRGRVVARSDITRHVGTPFERAALIAGLR